MAGITLAQAEAQLSSYLAAEVAILGKQSYKIAGRELTHADLGSIQEGIKIWNERVRELSNSASGRGRTRTVVVGG